MIRSIVVTYYSENMNLEEREWLAEAMNHKIETAALHYNKMNPEKRTNQAQASVDRVVARTLDNNEPEQEHEIEQPRSKKRKDKVTNRNSTELDSRRRRVFHQINQEVHQREQRNQVQRGDSWWKGQVP